MGITLSRCFSPAIQLSGGPVPLLFSSVRLIPCTAAHAVEGGISTVENIAGRVGSSVKGAGTTVGASVKDELRDMRDDFDEARARARHAAESVRQGLDGGEGARDNRLLMQLAMLLGFAYVAFLTLWFWVTRTRRIARRA